MLVTTLLNISYICLTVLCRMGVFLKVFSLLPYYHCQKKSKLDLKNSSNYRAISLSSVFGKVFEKIIIEKRFEQLSTFGLQFGCKRNSSNLHTTMLLETIEYYVSNMSAVFVLYIDASKAFDRVCHSKLFNVLHA